jgi:hypothetical protein
VRHVAEFITDLFMFNIEREDDCILVKRDPVLYPISSIDLKISLVGISSTDVQTVGSIPIETTKASPQNVVRL